MKYQCALITVSDMEKSIRFYKDILEQEIEFDFGENVSFKGGFALHLDTHFEMLTNQTIKRKNNSFELYFEHDNLKPVRDYLVKHEFELVHDLREQPWRQLVMRVYDPDGHIVEIGESIEHLCFRLHNEGLHKEEISRISNMNIDFVDSSIKLYEENHK